MIIFFFLIYSLCLFIFIVISYYTNYTCKNEMIIVLKSFIKISYSTHHNHNSYQNVTYHKTHMKISPCHLKTTLYYLNCLYTFLYTHISLLSQVEAVFTSEFNKCIGRSLKLRFIAKNKPCLTIYLLSWSSIL